MILCESAEQTVNLYYSVIKFVTFRGIVWAGDSLPLVLNSLGELIQVQIRLTDQDQTQVKPVSWERGALRASFLKGSIYDLYLRLEYRLPPAVTVFHSDFASIHPKSYRVGLDFPAPDMKGAMPRLLLGLGVEIRELSLEKEIDLVLASQHRVRVIQERDYCSVSIEAKTALPYAHRHFPVLTLQ